MKNKMWQVFCAVCALATAVVCAAPAGAQMSDVKEKPTMYTYIGNWAIPRARWAEMDKSQAASQKLFDAAVGSGTLVGYGNDTNLVHQTDGETHDDWWSAMSMAGVLNVLDQLYKAGGAASTILTSATKHSDTILMSRFYNWHSGSWKDVYTHGSSYKFKADAPDDALETLSKTVFVPMLEKLLADGTIHEYEIDTQAIHTQDPGTFWIYYIAANADALDKVNAALREHLKANPLISPSMAGMIDYTGHRDSLGRTNATFK